MKPINKKLVMVVVVLFVFSAITVLFGALAKLQHWPMAGTLLITGIVLQACGYLIGGIILLQFLSKRFGQKSDDKTNSLNGGS